MRLLLALASVLSVAGLGVSTATALTYAPTVSFEVVGGTGAVDVAPLGYGTTNGEVMSWYLHNPVSVDGALIQSWDAQLKEDPFVTNNFVVTNTTLAPQIFVATVLLPIPAFNYNLAVFSSIGVTTTDSNGDNSLSLSQFGATDFFQGQVNGGTVLPLGNSLLPLSTANCLPFPNVPGCSASGTDGVPLAGIALPPGVANSIAIVVSFSLSAGDSAAVTSRFEIIPEPATGVLLALGLLGLGLRSRRS